MATDWLRYANQGATRNQPLDPKLVEALRFLPELGLAMEVFSGGQASAGSGLARVGSTRHDHGNAADVFFYKGDKRLDWANPEDQPLFGDVVRRAKAAGVTGFGAGPGYMQPGAMHIGFGNPGVWGAGGKGANAPDWLRAAYGGAPSAAPAPVAGKPASAPQGLANQMAPSPVAPPPQAFGDFVAPQQASAVDFGSVVAQFMAKRQQSQQQQESDAAAERARKLALFG